MHEPGAEGVKPARGAHVPTTAVSLHEVRDRNPYPVYEVARQQGNVVWDQGMDGWLILDYEGCSFVEQREDLFIEPTGQMPGADLIAGRRDFRALTGERHRLLHHFALRLWAPHAVEPYRDAYIRPIVDARIGRFSSRGAAELWEDFASLVSIEVVGRILGLPPMDDDAMRKASRWTDAVLAWRFSYGLDPTLIAAAVDATRDLDAFLLPIIRAKKVSSTDDMVSGLWRIGAQIAPDWNERDVLDNVKFLFEGGSDTPGLLICTCMRIALDDSELRAAISAGGEPLRRFVDETLRHTTPVHWRARIATSDVQLGGVTIQAGDRVFAVNAAANRDPKHYANPDQFDIGRHRYSSHLAFNAGPRHCVGAWIARLEAYEAVRALLGLPNVRLNPDAAPPILAGYVERAYRPLHILFGRPA